MNYYDTVAGVKRALQIDADDLSRDAEIWEYLEAASREVEGPGMGNRVYWVGASESREFDGGQPGRDAEWKAGVVDVILIDDALDVTAIVEDVENDGTFSGTPWVEGVDYRLGPADKWPKTQIEVMRSGNQSLQVGHRRYKVTGVWGYGNGVNGNPWRETGVQVTACGYSAGRNGVQTVRVAGAVDGTFTLSFGDDETSAIDFDASAADVEAALAALPDVDGDVSVVLIDGAYVVAFDGALAGEAMPLLVADASGLEGVTPDEGEEAVEPVVSVAAAFEAEQVVVLSLATRVVAGMTIRVDDEQLFVVSTNTTDVAPGETPVHTAVVERGVNGTSIAAHDGAWARAAWYPIEATMATRFLTVEALRLMAVRGLASEGIGDFRQVFKETRPEVKKRLLGAHRKVAV